MSSHSLDSKELFTLLLNSLPNAYKIPKKARFTCSCPAHTDIDPSLSVRLKDGRLLMKCFGGCSYSEIVQSLKEKGLWYGRTNGASGGGGRKTGEKKKDGSRGLGVNKNTPSSSPRKKLKFIADYTYFSAKGEPLYFVRKYLDERKRKKTFRAYTIGENGEKGGGVSEEIRVLYNLPYIRQAAKKRWPVVFCEGEKDCDNVVKSLKLPATTIPFGAGGKWLDRYSENLEGIRHVIIVPDNDNAGVEGAWDRAEKLVELGIKVKVLDLCLGEERKKGFDISDWLELVGENARARFDKAVNKYGWFRRGKWEDREKRKKVRRVEDEEQGESRSEVISDIPYEREGDEKDDTDYGNLLRLYTSYGHLMRYLPDLKQWMVYNKTTGTWSESTASECFHELADRMLEDRTEREDVDDDTRRKLVAHAISLRSYARYRAVMNLASQNQLFRIDVSDFDTHPYKINAKNGVIDLQTGKLLPHSSEYMFRKSLTIPYTPSFKEPREWLDFLWSCFLREGDSPKTTREIIDYMQLISGYILIGSLDLAQIFVLLYGPGNTGKSTYLSVMRKILGEYCCDTRGSVFCSGRATGGADAKGYELARMAGARLVNAGELPTGTGLDAEMVKRVTDGKSVSARQIYGLPFSFPARFLLTLESNSNTYIDPQDSGLQRRARILFFENVVAPEEVVPELDGRLYTLEGSQILGWMVQGAARVIQNPDLLNCQNIPPSFIELQKQFMIEHDIVSRFVSDLCVVGEREQESSKQLYNAFLQWCDAEGERSLRHTHFTKHLKRAVPRLIHKVIRVGPETLKGFVGLSLKPNWLHLISGQNFFLN